MVSASETTIDPKWNDPDSYDGSYPPDWEDRRRAVYQRDDYTCTNCGRKSGPHAGDDGVRLHAHHKKPRADGGSNRLGNLTTLCEPCHDDAHDHDIFGDGWIGDGPTPTPGRPTGTGAGTGTRAGGRSRGRRWGARVRRSVTGEFGIAAVVAAFATWLLSVIGGVIGVYPAASTSTTAAGLAGTFVAMVVLTVYRTSTVWGGYLLVNAIFAAYVYAESVPVADPDMIAALAMVLIPFGLLSGGFLMGRIGTR